MLSLSPNFTLTLLSSYLSGDPNYRGYDILPIVSAVNLILQSHPNRSSGGGVMVGRNRFFFRSNEAPPFTLGGGLEAWRGFYSSVRPAYKQLMVNVNVCTTAFYVPGNLADSMMTFMNSTFGANMKQFVKGVRVLATHLGYKKTVKTVTNLKPHQFTFDCDELKKRVTVQQYFLESKALILFGCTLLRKIYRVQDPLAVSRSTSHRCWRGEEASPPTSRGLRDSSGPALPRQAHG